MPDVPTPAAIAPIALAVALFDEVSSLTSTPTDGVYADCLVSRAFSGLLTGLAAQDGPQQEALSECAEAVEGCNWLTDVVRAHVSRTLRDAGKGRVSIALAHQVVASAAQRTAHQMTTEIARAVGGDGASYLADAMDGIGAAIEGKTH